MPKYILVNPCREKVLIKQLDGTPKECEIRMGLMTVDNRAIQSNLNLDNLMKDRLNDNRVEYDGRTYDVTESWKQFRLFLKENGVGLDI